jgi:SAM-dependent methyltransferase
MFTEEAKWVEDALRLIKPLPSNKKVANLGSSTAYFREVIQPHINKHVLQPLKENNWQVFNVDLKPEEGVDEVADCTKKEFGQKYANQFGLTICTNMLEHVLDIPLVVQNLLDVTDNNGYIMLTVPYKYRIHHDPIDNGFRPEPKEIFNLFPSNKVSTVTEKIIVIDELDYYPVRKSRFPLWGQRERIKYKLGIKHKVSGILLKVNK